MSEEVVAGSESAGTENGEAIPASPIAPVVDWKDGLDADLRNSPSLATFDGLPALAKSFVETKALVGRQGVILPKEGDTDDLARFHREIGVPDSADAYTYEGVEAPEGMQLDTVLMDGMKGAFHKRGVTPVQASGIIEDYNQLMAGRAGGHAEQVGKAQSACKSTLEGKYGNAYDKNCNMAQAALEQRLTKEGASELLDFVDPNTGATLAYHPGFIDMIVTLAQGMAEDSSLHGHGPRQFALTPEEADRKLGEFNRDPEKQKALYDADHQAHNEAVTERDGLFAAREAGK
jgi:hypothetical protein